MVGFLRLNLIKRPIKDLIKIIIKFYQNDAIDILKAITNEGCFYDNECGNMKSLTDNSYIVSNCGWSKGIHKFTIQFDNSINDINCSTMSFGFMTGSVKGSRKKSLFYQRHVGNHFYVEYVTNHFKNEIKYYNISDVSSTTISDRINDPFDVTIELNCDENTVNVSINSEIEVKNKKVNKWSPNDWYPAISFHDKQYRCLVKECQ